MKIDRIFTLIEVELEDTYEGTTELAEKTKISKIK